MQPVLRRDAADAEVSAAQNLLADRCDHNGVIYIVVGRITAGNVFEREPCHKTDDAGIARLQQPIGSLIGELEFANKCFDDDLRRVEHFGHLRSLALAILSRRFSKNQDIVTAKASPLEGATGARCHKVVAMRDVGRETIELGRNFAACP